LKTNVRNIEAQAEQEAAAVGREVVCRVADGFERITMTGNHPLRLWGCAAARGGHLLLTRQLTKPRMVALLYALSVALGCARVIPWKDYNLTPAERDEVRRLVRKETHEKAN
jgi:hypothetical protein